MLDPHNFQAREFLTRVDARQKVASGQVGAEMGRDIETPIAVSSVAQEHEYLRLFGAEPLAHKTLDGVSIDRWDCLSASGDPVVYYFDYSQMYDWGFAGAEQRAAAGSAAARPRLSDPQQPVSRHQPRQIKANSNVVWESAVFK